MMIAFLAQRAVLSPISKTVHQIHLRKVLQLLEQLWQAVSEAEMQSQRLRERSEAGGDGKGY